jgi:uncharacterized membrane protein YsdA (DUF1294 family)
MGGWPGACLAQKFVRHKSRKPSFQIVFRISVALNCAALLWIAYLVLDVLPHLSLGLPLAR